MLLEGTRHSDLLFKTESRSLPHAKFNLTFFQKTDMEILETVTLEHEILTQTFKIAVRQRKTSCEE